MDLRTSELVCPVCGHTLAAAPGGTAVMCGDCDRDWPAVLGIPVFSDPDFYYGEIPRESMRTALALGPDRIEEVREKLAEAGPWLPRYAFDASRADWRVPLGVPHGGRALDYGCGLGAVSMCLAPHYATVCAADPTPERAALLSLRAKAAKRENVTAVGADIDTLPYPKRSFDLVVVMGVLEWTPLSFPELSPRDAELRQLRRLAEFLAPGGTLVLGIENRVGVRYFMGSREEHIDLPFVTLMPRRLADVYARSRGKGSYRNWTYSPRGTAALLAEAGLEAPEVYGAYFHYSFPDLVYPMNLANREAARLGSSLGAATNAHWRESKVFPVIRTGLERSRQFRKLAPSLLNRATAPGGARATMGLGARVHEVVVPSRKLPGTPMRTLRFRPDGAQMTLRSRDETGAAHLRRVEGLLRGLGSRPWLPPLRTVEEDGPDVVLAFDAPDGVTLADRIAADAAAAPAAVLEISAVLVEVALHDARPAGQDEAAAEAKDLGARLGLDTGKLVDLLGDTEAARGFAHSSVDLDRFAQTGSGWVLSDWDDMREHVMPLDGVADLVLGVSASLPSGHGAPATELWTAAIEPVRRALGDRAVAGLALAGLRRVAARGDGTDYVASLLGLLGG
ncbi:MAG: class I SAM-dependent methyltransferase [Acidimicrobiia bacterium]|nr:class I SAM-dependent methyltransferase [Acidimicrobiia bacterium]